MRNLVKNTFYVFGAQLFILLMAVLRSLILPLFFDIESYGYWQIYLFYSAYVLLFGIGFSDGIYLKYGDKNYNDLPFEKLRNSVWIFSYMLLLISATLAPFIFFFIQDENLQFSILAATCNIFTMGLLGVFTHILQITNQLKRYSIFSVIDKVFVLFSVLIMFLLNNDNFRVIIYIDLIAKIIVLIASIIVCKELVFGKKFDWFIGIKELKANIKIGQKVLIANILGMLIIGFGRFFIQLEGGIDDFANYSFGIAITGIVVTAITAFSLVLYPFIKRIDTINYHIYFRDINSGLMGFSFIFLLLYFPSYWLLDIFYAKFTNLLPYLNVLFVIPILQGKMSVLNNTFYKAIRREKEMLNINFMSFLLLIVSLPITFFYTRSITSIALVTFIVIMVRGYVAEIYLKRLLLITRDNDFLYEIFLLSSFLILTFLLPLNYAALFFIFFLGAWILYMKSKFVKIFRLIKTGLR